MLIAAFGTQHSEHHAYIKQTATRSKTGIENSVQQSAAAIARNLLNTTPPRTSKVVDGLAWAIRAAAIRLTCAIISILCVIIYLIR